MPQLITIQDTQLEHLLYQEQPVVTFQQIADVHGIAIRNVHQSFRRHRTEFTEGEDYIRLDYRAASQLLPGVEANPNGLILFTEQGYLLLTKPMKDKVSWQVQKRMIKDYFALRVQQQLRVQSPWDVMANLVAIGKAHEQQMLALEAEQTRQLQSMIALQAQTIANQAQTIEAHALATRALEAQLWMTLRQYRYVNNLQRQLSDADLKSFSHHLTQYCLEEGIPIAVEPVADKIWGKENKYHVATIAEVLPQWLHRRGGQKIFPIAQN